jgi:carboxyl-terminal processing protease
VPTKRFLAPTLLLVLFAALLVQLPMAIAGRTTVYELFDPIVEVRRILVDRYVREPDEKQMQRAMIDVMIDQLDDPYTQYIPPAAERDFNKQLRGTYAGIGAEVNIDDGYLVIVSPMDDSPALRAGVMAGDVVLEIEGETTFEMPLSECVDRLTGELGTPVTMKVRHLDGAEEDLEIIRDQIVTRTARGVRRIGEEWSHCVDGDLGLSYIRVTQFNAATIGELAEDLEELRAAGQLNGLILDLRDNPGGGLPVAVAMADLFLSRGTIVSVRPRIGDEMTYRASPDGAATDFPMLVLVNGSSASASEIVAGALQENDRAHVLGTRTFGKGSVQEVRSLAYDAGTLKYTTAHYHLPSGRNLNRGPDDDTWGVDPNPGFIVPVTDDAYLDSFRARREFEIIRETNGDVEWCVSAEWIRTSLLDEQLAAAVEAISARVTGGAWVPPGDLEDDATLVAASQELRRATATRTRLIERLRHLEEQISEMEGRAADAGRPPLLPEDVDLSNGRITVADRDGTTIGSFRIAGGDVPMALAALELRRLDAEEPRGE